jgi:hypothetical protein
LSQWVQEYAIIAPLKGGANPFVHYPISGAGQVELTKRAAQGNRVRFWAAPKPVQVLKLAREEEPRLLLGHRFGFHSIMYTRSFVRLPKKNVKLSENYLASGKPL